MRGTFAGSCACHGRRPHPTSSPSAAAPPLTPRGAPTAVQPLWAADRAAQTRPVQCLLQVLAPARWRAPPAPIGAAPLSDVRATRAGAPPRSVRRLLLLLAPARPRAPR